MTALFRDPVIDPDPSWSVTDATKLSSFLACPRSFFWRHRLGLTTVEPSRHLSFGIAVHEGLAVLYAAARDGRPWTSDLAAEAADAMERSYRSLGFAPATDPSSGTKTPAAFRKALPVYMERWATDLIEWETVSVEETFAVELPDDAGPLYGRMDVVQRRKYDGAYRVLEHKTAGSLGTPWVAQWALSHQVGGYDYALRATRPGEPVLGVTINAVECPRSGGLRFDRVDAYRSLGQAKAWIATVGSALRRIQAWDETVTEAPNGPTADGAYPQNPTACGNWGGCEFLGLCGRHPDWRDGVRDVAEHGPPRGFKIEWWNPMKEDVG